MATLKNELSRFLKTVSEGEEIVVISHERAIAKIVPFESPGHLVMRPPTRPAADLSMIKGIRPSRDFDVVKMLIEDRRR